MARALRRRVALPPPAQRVCWPDGSNAGVGNSPLYSAAAHAARQLIESLRVGIAPAQHVRTLTIGLAAEQASLQAALDQTQTTGGGVRAVIGDYGYGKSHVVELAAAEGLRRNFLVASISLDRQELPPHRAFDIYRAAMMSLRYPNSDERGLTRLLTQAADSAVILPQMQNLAPVANDPLVVALHALNNVSATRRRQMWMRWLGGGSKPRSLVGLPRGSKFPSIYTVGHNARQIAYLLTGISALARLCGYSGLCLLVDEAESYSLLYPYQRPRAATVFQSIIYAALRDGQQRLAPRRPPVGRIVLFGGQTRRVVWHERNRFGLAPANQPPD